MIFTRKHAASLWEGGTETLPIFRRLRVRKVSFVPENRVHRGRIKGLRHELESGKEETKRISVLKSQKGMGSQQGTVNRAIRSGGRGTERGSGKRDRII